MRHRGSPEETTRNAAILADKIAGLSFTELQRKYNLGRSRLFRIVEKERARQEERKAYVNTRQYPPHMDEHARLMLDALKAIAGDRRGRLMLMREWGYNGNLFQTVEMMRFIATVAAAGPKAMPSRIETPLPPGDDNEDVI